MVKSIRITPEEAHKKLESHEAILVCAYEDDVKYKQMQLQEAISLSEFKSRLPSLAKDKEIIFYCA
ncbi:MAG: ArsR family transcriptional regulator [Candidatus Jettenia sp. CY-1]|nr:MAG: ArsR family transcriptional regulator [Candidatus Jettenia sp. CY-1]